MADLPLGESERQTLLEACEPYAAVIAERLIAENARLTEQVRQMGLHSLGCSGKVGTDGVECEWPDEGPCLVADLRAEIARLRALEAVRMEGERLLAAQSWDGMTDAEAAADEATWD